MAKNKGVRIVITLSARNAVQSRQAFPRRVPLHDREEPPNTTERLEIKKFCPHCNKMTPHKEIK